MKGQKEGIEQSIRVYGNPPWRIGLLHGGPGASGEMKPVAEILAEEFGILELLQTEKSLEGQIQELYNQLTAAAELPVILVGYSWGVWLGMLFAARYPKYIRKLILISSGVLENKYNQDLMKIRMDRLSGSDRKEVENILPGINSGMPVRDC